MIATATLRQIMAEVVGTLSAEYDVGAALYRLTDQMLHVLDLDGAGVSMDDGRGRLAFVTATDDRVVRLEQAQLESGEGPCMTAFGSGERQVVDDLETFDGWGQYVTIAKEQGIRSVAGLPMRAGERVIGAVNLYREEPDPWEEDLVETAQLMADMASAIIVNARTLDESRTLNTQLQTALDSRVVIEQAKGILAERHGIDVADAFQRLRDHSRATQRRLHDVARDVVAGRAQL